MKETLSEGRPLEAEWWSAAVLEEKPEGALLRGYICGSFYFTSDHKL